ncbi:hypothetical protein HPB50_024002 [Hyalomma asiaticum]|uniref:Uncharacterized protein n=1 Tax=Hyalomma asiaticum TaxID=266040 RepID=A0ACB7S867_HYAAI|nr:hypothetical protein HPB50_024002 [Hyalomma asiaticum]
MASNETEQWDAFFCATKPPADFDEQKRRIDEFCSAFADTDDRVVLITSGGTTVPLEHNTVRFVDNFSAGTRGSASAEYFLDQGYAVLFLFRSTSLQPFVRRFKPGELLSYLQFASGDDSCIQVRADAVSKVRPALEGYQRAMTQGVDRRLLQVCFTTLTDYLFLLKACAVALRPLGYRALLYLAAAVSDFYVPPENMLVIGNELHSRKHRVILVTNEDYEVINLTPQQMAAGVEIEQIIVEKLLWRHMEHIDKCPARRPSTDDTTSEASVTGSSTPP